MQPLPQTAWTLGPDLPLFWINLRSEKEFSWTCLKYPCLEQTKTAEGRKVLTSALFKGHSKCASMGRKKPGTGSSAEMEATGGDDLEVRGPAGSLGLCPSSAQHLVMQMAAFTSQTQVSNLRLTGCCGQSYLVKE